MQFPDEISRIALSRRQFLKTSAIGSLGAAALSSAPESMAKALALGISDPGEQVDGIPSGIARLNFNENPLGPSPKAIEAIRTHLHDINRFGINASDLFKGLNRMAGVDYSDLDLHKREDQDKMWKRNRVYLSDGSGNLLRAAAFACLRNGGEVIEANPGYGNVSEHASYMVDELGMDVKVNRVPLTSEFRHDLDAMHKEVNDRTKLVVVTNPNNPTGTVVPRADLEQFIASMPDHVTVLVDEAYMDYVKEPGYKSMGDVAVSRPNVLVTRTFSIIFGLPGVRVGYALAVPETLKNFWVYTCFPSSIALHAATAALEDTGHVAATRQMTWEGRDYLYRELDAMGLSYVRTESNFMLVEVGDAEEITRKLARLNVYVRNADRTWKVNNHVRVSIGTREENQSFITALRQVSA